jgi:hypothetical protein
MKEHPILFCGEMVNAILNGRKTQTRRIIKPQPFLRTDGFWQLFPSKLTNRFCTWEQINNYLLEHCPYGQIGDRLWVKESWKIIGWDFEGRFTIQYRDEIKKNYEPSENEITDEQAVKYAIQCSDDCMDAGLKSDLDGNFICDGILPTMWRSPLFMPRWASRITLEIINVRIQRVQEISEDDAKSEGCLASNTGTYIFDAVDSYQELWDSINAKRDYSWESNPYVWVIEFRRMD